MSPDAAAPDPTAVPLLPAATVMLVRDGGGPGGGLEVCLLRRNLRSQFVGGAYVFPGGAVDPADGAPEVAALCDGRTEPDAARVLGVETGALAYWVAAIRESFEECALLPARWAGDGAPLRFDDDGIVRRFAAYRQAVDAGERRLADVFAEEGLRFDLGAMHYVAHWVTPAGAPRRYDTRFFLAAAPPAQQLAHDDREVIAAEWLRPGEALDRHAKGDFSMLPPTTASLRWLAGFESAASALEAAAAIGTVPRIEPRVLTGLDGSVSIVLPSDPGYADAYDGEPALPKWRP